MNKKIETDHADMVLKLVKPGQKIIDELSPNRAHTLHMAVGISGESGEILDEIKKYVFQNKESNLNNIILELGDLEFYLEGFRQGLGITREETLEANMKKLQKRYKDFNYSDEAAINREDEKTFWILLRLRMDGKKQYVVRITKDKNIILSYHIEDAMQFDSKLECSRAEYAWNHSISRHQFGIELITTQAGLT